MQLRTLLGGTAALVLLSACETTGDPNQGGLFGWSEGKAKQRQAALHDALYLEEDRGAAARSQTGSLRAQKSRNAAAIRSQRASLNRMMSQLDEVDRAGGNTGRLRSRISQTRNSDEINDSDVQSLDSEVRSLRAEYGLLQKRR